MGGLSLAPFSNLPTMVAHADWSVDRRKRWLAIAKKDATGNYLAGTPELIGESAVLLRQLYNKIGPNGSLLLGFDFPIGLPMFYSQKVGINNFLSALPILGRQLLPLIYQVAERPDQVSLERPFYPQRPGGARHSHLLEGLGAPSMDHLRRVCELGRPGRPAASPLFWTLGARQVGKAAIHGWREVLAPSIRDTDFDLAIWPFSGRVEKLLKTRPTVAVETYPAEFYTHLGLQLHISGSGSRTGKRVQPVRAKNAPRLIDYAKRIGLQLSPELEHQIIDGFGDSSTGEDRFDSVVGLFGMIGVLSGVNPIAEPGTPDLRDVEGWIFGQPLPTSHR